MTPKPDTDVFSFREPARASFLAFADTGDARWAEHVIAIARLLVSLGLIQMLRWAEIGSSQHGYLVPILLAAYCSWGLVFLIVVHRHDTMRQRLSTVEHVIDICCPAVLASLHRVDGPLLMLLLFPLLSAGYRWGFRGVIITATAVDLLLAAGSVMVNSSLGVWLGIAMEQFDLNAFMSTEMVVGVMGGVIGYFAENEHRRRSEAIAVSRVIAQARPGADFNDTLNQVLVSFRDSFGARTALLVLQDMRTERVFTWASDPLSTTKSPTAKEIPATARNDYLFAAPGVAWHAVGHRVRRRGQFDVIAIDSLGRGLPSPDLLLPAGFLTAHRCRRLLCVALTIGEEWRGRLFVIEPVVGIRRVLNARFALRLASQTVRVMYGHYLVHRVRMRAQAIERGRISRELHDGLIQSLLGLEMQLAVVRRRAIAEAPEIDRDLSRIHTVLRNEVTTLRELMEGIRAGSSAHQDLISELAEMVERFQRYTGIAADFDHEQPFCGVSAHTRRQIARILHEALANVRKHSSAKRVLVRTRTVNGQWRLSIEDDGRGFPFAGRRSQAELDAIKKGPRMISERVHMIGGEMTVESRPGSGARVEVAIPL